MRREDFLDGLTELLGRAGTRGTMETGGGRVRIRFSEAQAGFIVSHEPFAVVGLEADVRSQIDSVAWIEHEGNPQRREKVVTLGLMAAIELRDWLIHVRNRYSRPMERDEDKLALTESALKVVNEALQAARGAG